MKVPFAVVFETKVSLHITLLLPPASAVEVIETVPSVCMCVCASVCEHSHDVICLSVVRWIQHAGGAATL